MLNFPVFIVGSPRSGTSILVQALLGAGYSGHHEGNLLSVLHGLERQIDTHFRIFGSTNPLVLTSHINAPAIKAGLYSKLRDMIDEHHRGQAWFDKTGNPEMIEAIPALRAMWPNSRFIFAKRRAIENITSRLTKFPKLNFEYHCADWARNMSSWRRIVGEMPDLPHIEIDQYDIARTPDGVAAGLAMFLELSMPAQQKLTEIFENDRPQETSRGSARQMRTLQSTGWNEQQQQLFHKHCDAQMAVYQYTEDERYSLAEPSHGIGLYRRPEATDHLAVASPAPAAAPAAANPHELGTLLQKLADDDLSLADLLTFYIDYQGPIFPEQIAAFRHKAARMAAAADIAIDITAATAPGSKMGLQILARAVPALANHNYQPAGIADFKPTMLLPAGPNELYDPAILPEPFRDKLAWHDRPEFSAFTRERGRLFIGPRQYQYFSEPDDVYYPDAASRQFSKSIAANPSMKVSGHVMLIQDRGAGFSHFAYDWMPRMIHALASGLAGKTDTVFVMGGENGPFQRLLIDALTALHDLTPANFLFPETNMILDVDGMFSFFSDQRLAPMYPAQMAHPVSMGFLRELAARIPGPKGNTERLFISRGDARSRRISNQEELSAIAATRGYKTVELAKLPMAAQFSAFRNAKRIIGGHGMGFSHLLFCERQVAMLELLHPRTGGDAYAMIAKSRGFTYRHMTGEDDADGRLSYRIDPDEFSRVVDEML